MKRNIYYIIFFLIIFLIQPVSGAWNVSTVYYTETPIINGSRPYQLNLTIHTGSGTNNATDIFCNGHCNANLSDLFFYANDTPLYFWIENQTNGRVHVNVTVNGTVSAHYGNTTLTARNNTIAGQNTWLWFDDFEDAYYADRWTYNTGTPTETGGYLAYTPEAGWYSSLRSAYSPTAAQSWRILAEAGVQTNATSNTVAIGQVGTQHAGSVASQQLTIGQHGLTYMNMYAYNAAANYSYMLSAPYYSWYPSHNILELKKRTGYAEGRIYSTTGQEIANNSTTTQVPDFTNPLGIYGATAPQIRVYWFAVGNYNQTEPRWATWTAQKYYYSNNYTNNQNLTISPTLGTNVSFVMMGTPIWFVNDVYDGAGASNTTIKHIDSTTTSIKAISSIDGTTLIWYISFPFALKTPANESTGISTNTPLTWQEYPESSPYNYYIATDNQFINIIASGIGTITNGNGTSPNITLTSGTKYYWKVTNGTGATSDIFEFTTAPASTTPGQFNITAFDEVNNTRLSTFTAQIYNSTYMMNKSTTTGWANFSSSEVAAGEYSIRIVPNSSYASRSVLATSPGIVTMYLPSTTNTINTIAFYLLDYTTLFPYSTTKFILTKNNTEMYSAYFDADAKTTVYLIQGDSYKITLENGDNVQEWGNYIAVSSGNVEITVTDIGIPDLGRYNYNISTNPALITLNWSELSGTLNFTIRKGANKTTVHQLITTVTAGQSNYIITEENIYYITMSANSSGVIINRYFAYDTRPANATTIGTKWGYGSYTIPQQYMNYGSIIFILVLSGVFGALHAALGGVVLILTTLFTIKNEWLQGDGITAGFFSGLAVLVVIVYLRDKDSD